VTPAEALRLIRQRAVDRTLPIVVDADQLLWNLGAVGGVQGLLELLANASGAEPTSDGGFRVEVEGATVVVDGELVVTGIGMK
jgi:hypothetical protein